MTEKNNGRLYTDTHFLLTVPVEIATSLYTGKRKKGRFICPFDDMLIVYHCNHIRHGVRGLRPFFLAKPY